MQLQLDVLIAFQRMLLNCFSHANHMQFAQLFAIHAAGYLSLGHISYYQMLATR